MAQLKLSGLVDRISGKIGGSVLGKSSNGDFIRQNAYTKKFASQSQQQQRTKIYEASKLWRNISASNKSAWAAATSDYPYTNKVGDTATYNAYQLFLKLNMNLLLINEPTISTPPTFVPFVMPTYTLGTVDHDSLDINFSGDTNQNAATLYSAPVVDPSKILTWEDMRFYSDKPGGGTSGIVFSYSTWANNFGTLTPGQRVYVGIKSIQTDNGNTQILSELLTAIVA